MASSALRLASLAALVLLVILSAAIDEASSYQPYEDSTDVFVDSHHCREEIRRHRLGACCDLMRRSFRGGGSMLMTEDEAEEPDEEGVQSDCCQQLRRVTERCRCDAIDVMMRDLKEKEGYEMGREMMEEIERKARSLPSMCGMSPRRCPVRIKYGFEY